MTLNTADFLIWSKKHMASLLFLLVPVTLSPASDLSWFLLLAQQQSGATLDPFFWGQSQFLVVVHSWKQKEQFHWNFIHGKGARVYVWIIEMKSVLMLFEDCDIFGLDR